MKKFGLAAISLLSVFSLGLSGCASATANGLTEGIEKEQVTGKAGDSDFVNANMSFSLELFKNVQKEKNGENVLVSPLSVAAALAMTANGAQGETLAEMERLLGDGIPLEQLNSYLYSHLDSLTSGEGFKLHIANSVWFRDYNGLTVHKDFLQKTVDYYDAEVYREAFDSKTVNAINNWVKANTDGMIPKIIDKIDSDTIMYLINALAFDAEWAETYSDHQVNSGIFTDSMGKEHNVKMMSSTEHRYLEDEKAVGFIKGYKGGKYCFAALLPNEDVTLAEYIDSLTAEKLLNTLSEPHLFPVKTKTPKFSFDFGLSLNDTLKAMGMPLAFEGEGANFSKMADCVDGNVYIGNVLHKTFIAVDENGTKAGAAASVEMIPNSAAPGGKPITVILDRPFVFMIIDSDTKLPVFMGAVESV